jgi:DNA-binding transcriptional regulator YhcF (GntR family)
MPTILTTELSAPAASRQRTAVQRAFMDFQVPNTLAEQIANYLGERIMTGQIRPGERIQEATLAAELKVSRASVKEALYTLERWHLVAITPRKGAAATHLDAEHAAELYYVYMHLLLTGPGCWRPWPGPPSGWRGRTRTSQRWWRPASR